MYKLFKLRRYKLYNEMYVKTLKSKNILQNSPKSQMSIHYFIVKIHYSFKC